MPWLWIAASLFLLASAGCRRDADNAGPAGPPPARIAVSVPHDPETLDPHLHDRLGEFVFSSQIFEPLVKTDADMGIAPSLASRWVNPDLLTWIFYLRPSVTFHDGRPLRAADVVYSIERLRQHPELENSVYTLPIQSVRALDGLTVEIRTSHPMSLLLNKLSLVHIVPEGSAATLAKAPVGTGPYRLVSFTPGSSLRLRRFQGYWGRKPDVEEAAFSLARTPDEATTDVLTGRSQIVQNPSRMRAAEIEHHANLAIYRRTGNFLVHAAFNLSSRLIAAGSSEANPFLRRGVRRAVSLAIDRPGLARALPTFVAPASQLVPTFIFGHHPSLREQPFDPREAKALLAREGYPDGFSVTLHVRKILAETAHNLRSMLADVGIKTQVVELSDSGFFALRENGGPTFFINRFGCTTGDASDLWDAGFHTRDENYGASNISGFSDRKIDELIERSSELAETPGQRAERLHDIMSRVMEEMLWVPLYFQDDVFVAEKRFSLRPRADSVLLLSEITIKNPL